MHWKGLVPLVASLLAARTGFAKDTDVQERAARTACLSGDYAKGIAILEELFAASKDPARVYDQGRCFEQNRRYEDAIDRFEEFLRIGQKLTKSEKAEARRHIGECEDLIAKQGGLSPASADDNRRSKQRAARKACLSGNTDKGSEILSDLYLDTKDPTHIYNLGRCYEQNHRYEDAISRFREYLLKASNLTEQDRAETEKHIATCQSYVGKSEPPQSPPPVEASRVEERPMPIAPQEGTTAENEVVATTVPEPSVAGPGEHARQPGLFLQYERVLMAGLSYGIVRGLEIEAGALIGYHKGGWLGLRYLFLDGGVKPGLGIATPIFVVDSKAVAGVEGNAIVQWDLTRHLGLYASLGVAYFPSAASDLGRLWFLPGIGAQARL